VPRPLPDKRGILPSGRPTSRQFCWERVRDPKEFDRRSFRQVTPPGRGDVRIVIGCPKGKWDPRAKKCKVGTRAQTIGHKLPTPKCSKGVWEILDRERTGGLLIPFTEKRWGKLADLERISPYRGKCPDGPAHQRKRADLALRRKTARRLLGLARKRLRIDADFKGLRGMGAGFVGSCGLVFGTREAFR